MFNFEVKNDLKIRLNCPECSKEVLIDSIDSIPRNLAIQQFLDIKPIEIQSEKKCDECNNNFNELTTCLHCSNSICLECKSKHLKEFEIQLKRKLFNLNEKYNNYISSIY